MYENIEVLLPTLNICDLIFVIVAVTCKKLCFTMASDSHSPAWQYVPYMHTQCFHLDLET